MKAHTLKYFKAFKIEYDEKSGWHEFIRCEYSLCNDAAVDICHINPRGMGGNPDESKDDIKNLIALCRFHHSLTEGVYKRELAIMHQKRIEEYHE